MVLGADGPDGIRRWANRACLKTGTPWVEGGYHGPHMVTGGYVPGDGACWECLRLGENREIDLKVGSVDDHFKALPKAPGHPVIGHHREHFRSAESALGHRAAHRRGPRSSRFRVGAQPDGPGRAAAGVLPAPARLPGLRRRGMTARAAAGTVRADSVVAFHPLARRVDGPDVVIGRTGTDVFVSLPAIGAEAIDLLEHGTSIGDAEDRIEAATGERIDVADLAAALLELGMVAEVDGRAVPGDPPARVTLPAARTRACAVDAAPARACPARRRARAAGPRRDRARRSR